MKHALWVARYRKILVVAIHLACLKIKNFCLSSLITLFKMWSKNCFHVTQNIVLHICIFYSSFEINNA